MQIRSISSGSAGNCSLVITSKTRLIIDIGVSYLTLKRSVEEIGLSLSSFSGILITHCHKDHTSGLASLVKHTNLMAYIPEKMYPELSEVLPKERCQFIGDNFTISDLTVELIHTSHDAACSVGYIITSNTKSLVYITDTGYINRKYLSKMHEKDLYFIESNHDEKLLMDGPYPRFLKERVMSDVGHLSNGTTAQYLQKLVGPNTKNIILAHLSKTNNTKELALQTIRASIPDQRIKITIAKEHEETELIEV